SASGISSAFWRAVIHSAQGEFPNYPNENRRFFDFALLRRGTSARHALRVFGNIERIAPFFGSGVFGDMKRRARSLRIGGGWSDGRKDDAKSNFDFVYFWVGGGLFPPKGGTAYRLAGRDAGDRKPRIHTGARVS